MLSLIVAVLAMLPNPTEGVVKISAVKYDLGGSPPNLTGLLAPNFDLTEAEKYKLGELKGPESFVFYRGHVYTGLADGRVVDISDCGVRTVAKLAPPGCKGEADCGRPLGLRLDNRGRLLVADAHRGIYRVDLDTGDTELLFSTQTPVNGRRCRFINDLLVAKDGTILFTDSSSRWPRDQFLYILLEGETTGRLLAYSDKSNKTIVVLDNLAFPNGLEFGPNEESVLIAETARARIRRLSLKPGQTWLQLTTWAGNLPGLPDNIRASSRGTYWVAMSQARHSNKSNPMDEFAGQPVMREMVAMMSTMDQILAKGEKYGMVLELNNEGQIIRSLQDPTGQHIGAISEVAEHDGFLYLGSFDQPYVSRVALSQTFHVERFLQKIKSTCRATKVNIAKLRVVLRRLVAIAEFRRALLGAKKRRDDELLVRAVDLTTLPTTSSTTDSQLVQTTNQSMTVELNTNTTDWANGTDIVTVPLILNTTSAPTTTTEAPITASSTTVDPEAPITASSTTVDPEAVVWNVPTAASIPLASVSTRGTTGAEVVRFNTTPGVTDSEGVTATRVS